MSEKLFEIAFSGQIADGADLQSVKLKIAKIFKADEDRLAQMFSGRRVLIKRQADEITMVKYRGAFQKAGAICEIVDLSIAEAGSHKKADQPLANKTSSVVQNDGSEYVSKYPESDEVTQALLSTPLTISGDEIEDLVTDVAPVGSPMQHQILEAEEPVIDISGIDVAPVGSDLSPIKADEPPPPPDTTGLTMAD